MSELSQREFWFIQTFFKAKGFYKAHDLHDIGPYMRKLSCWDWSTNIASLIEKNVLSLSPDGEKVKFTDYGIELYFSTVKAQEEWDKQRVVKISHINQDQILIHSGETFKANRVIREIISQAKRELCILDPYIEPYLFDLLEDSNSEIEVRIITSDKARKAALLTYEAYKKQYAHAEMRIIATSAKFRDCFVLWDNSRGFHFEHPIRALGKEDTQLNLIKNPSKQMALFEERWAEAKTLEADPENEKKRDLIASS